jgi:formate hydrogenlyase transcriptional activator
MPFSELIGSSREFRTVLDHINTVAPADCSVLIRGETGTGKEIVAKAIHELSPRRQHRFVAINCAAIPAALLESELFGHERGAFTGAVTQTTGRFQLADRGTLFLDEIGDLPLELQPKLLRVLQEQEFERLGGGRSQHVDVRVIAATNQDLGAMVQERRFRADLFYRLHVFPITLPPLRERKDDIQLLTQHFLHIFARRHGKSIQTIATDALEVLNRHDWPGNIRELQNFIERAVILTTGSELRNPASESFACSVASTSTLSLAHAKRAHILAALQDTQWVVGGPRGAAVRLGLARTTLISVMQRLGISRPTSRGFQANFPEAADSAHINRKSGVDAARRAAWVEAAAT